MIVARKKIDYNDSVKTKSNIVERKSTNIRKVDEETYKKNWNNYTEDFKVQKKNLKLSFKINILLGAFFLVLMCVALLLSYAQVTSLKYKITEQKTEISKVTEEIQRYDIDLDKIRESGWIEKYALQKLNMKYPVEDQVIYLKVNKDLDELTSKNIENQLLVGSRLTSFLLDTFIETTNKMFLGVE